MAVAGAPGQDGHEYGQHVSCPLSVNPGSSGMAAAGVPGQDGRNRPMMAMNMSRLQLSRRQGSRIFRNGRSRSTRARSQEPADDGHEYVQASAEPAAGIEDLQEWPQPERQGEKPGTGR
ncbi:hypothetical protein NRS6110_04267 [Bacillus subtilis]|nr:hypothetical protein NRS6116_03954 [Bacillus subtilis]CAF1786599.1 hypothetical protein NRS6110_04267 [Bacillus subtilis]CAI6331365.1 hypothetical protein NRS6116_22795 [Bacillus subtilis]